MKFHFSLMIEGNDSVEQKFQKEINENPEFQGELITMFALSVNHLLRLKKEDNVRVISFRAGKVAEEEENSSKE